MTPEALRQVLRAVPIAMLVTDRNARLVGANDAAEALLGLHAANPDDPILALHARRIRAGERSVSMAA